MIYVLFCFLEFEEYWLIQMEKTKANSRVRVSLFMEPKAKLSGNVTVVLLADLLACAVSVNDDASAAEIV